MKEGIKLWYIEIRKKCASLCKIKIKVDQRLSKRQSFNPYWECLLSFTKEAVQKRKHVRH